MTDTSNTAPNVPSNFLPSPYQRKTWGRYVDLTETDGNGSFLGECPMCRSGAVFNFKAGILRCEGEPCCHGTKRAMSLSNVAMRMMRDHEG